MNYVSPVIYHIPHSSRNIPQDIRPSIVLSDADLKKEMDKMTDAFTDELFAYSVPDEQKTVFPVSRLTLDPERFLDDDKEPMARLGMGVIYTHTSDGRQLRHPPALEERNALIRRFYHPHHKKFESSVCASIQHFGQCLIIDCHSFPSQPLPYESDQNSRRPDICIGSDAFHTSKQIEREAVAAFAAMGFDVDVNRPFSGTIVPMAHYNKEKRVQSIMIEINRKLYMDEQTCEKNHQFDALKGYLVEICQHLHRIVSK
jgi:N-formylglutamate amidohydrolase